MADRYTLSVAGGSGGTRGRGGDDASPDTDGTVTEPQLRPPLPRQADPAHLARNRFLGTASSDDDDITIKPRALTKLEALSHAITIRGLGGRLRLATTSSSSSSSSFRTATNRSTSTTARQDQGRRGNALLDRFLALPPELQLAVLSYLNFSDLARLRRTCRFFRARVSPPLVRALLAPDFDRHVRHTCRVCLVQYASGAALVVAAEADAAAAEADPHFPLSSRCVGCVWDASGFDVGRKYRMGNDTAVFVCRWCGRPVGAQPAWNQPEFHKPCFKRYTKVVFLYYQLGLAQWVVTIIASGLCWHYFRTRMLWVNAVVAAGFVVTLWNFCLNAVRGTVMRTYHLGLLFEALIFASWVVPLHELLLINRQQTPPRAMSSYETATAVFVLFNLLCRGTNIIGNAILMCEYKMWRHKKPRMSAARSAWVHALEVFIFFVEPQCIEQEYPAKWWFSRRRPVPPPDDDFFVIHMGGGVAPDQPPPYQPPPYQQPAGAPHDNHLP